MSIYFGQQIIVSINLLDLCYAYTIGLFATQVLHVLTRLFAWRSMREEPTLLPITVILWLEFFPIHTSHNRKTIYMRIKVPLSYSYCTRV